MVFACHLQQQHMQYRVLMCTGKGCSCCCLQVMATSHILAGQELAIDRATPKDRSPPAGAGMGSGAGSRSGAPPAPASNACQLQPCSPPASCGCSDACVCIACSFVGHAVRKSTSSALTS
jgi:hypothetical protein